MGGKVFTVLVVDDEANIRVGAERVLRGSGFEVVTAESGEGALEVLAERECHIVLLDLMMPGMGGMAVLKRLEVDHPELLAIVVTGHATLETAVEAMKEGAYDFVAKPFQPDGLRIVVFRAADTLRLREEHRRLAEERLRTLKDIDEEKSRTRAIIECMTEGVLVTDRDGEVVLHNSGALRLLGLRDAPEVGSQLEAFVSDESLQDAILSVCTGGMGSATCTEGLLSLEVELQDGRWLLAKVTPIVTEWAGCAGALTVLSDITNQKLVDRLKTELVATVSHELRSPLASINHQLALVLYDLIGEDHREQRELLSRARERTRGLLGMISDLLDISRIEAGAWPAESGTVDLRASLAASIELVRPRAEADEITLEASLPDGPAEIEGDAREVDGVFANLLTNAVSYTARGGVVRVEASIEDGTFVARISDTGIGIAPENQERVFEKFYRVKSEKTRGVTGTGLGLPIVRGIVEAHGGEVTLESELGRGSTFTVRLPLS